MLFAHHGNQKKKKKAEEEKSFGSMAAPPWDAGSLVPNINVRRCRLTSLMELIKTALK